jgi:hypothetical protein
MKVSIEHSRFIKNILNARLTKQDSTHVKDSVDHFANSGCFFAMALQNGFTIKPSGSRTTTTNPVTRESSLKCQLNIEIPTGVNRYTLIAEVNLLLDKALNTGSVDIRFPKLANHVKSKGRFSTQEPNPYEALFIVGGENTSLLKLVNRDDQDLINAKLGYIQHFWPVTYSLLQTLKNNSISA